MSTEKNMIRSQTRAARESLPASLSPEILREYDIRGQIGINLGPEQAELIGRAFGTYIRRRIGGETVCVGYDGRHSSPGLAQALIDGLAQTGLQVTNVGLGPTPMLYFAVKDLMQDGGIMITGSHNPPDYNGFKLTLQNGPIFGETIQEIGEIAASGDFETPDAKGSVRTLDIAETYIERLLRDFSCKRDFKVAWDAGNGAAGAVLHKLVSRLPGEHILLYDAVDGDFPNHHPDPTVDENMRDLQNVVTEQGCDLGIAFDGDGDRIGAIDEKGNILRCDMLMTVYARDVLENNPGAPIIGDVKCSQVMFDEISRLGGRPVMWKTGHSLIKAKMAEMNAPLAGELSGHIFFGDKYYGFDDALYCAVRLLAEMNESESPLSGLTAHLPRPYSTPEIRFEVDEAEKFVLVPRVLENLRPRAEQEGFEIIDTDGVRVITEGGWWLLRHSNTQNVLVSRIEAVNPGAMAAMKRMLAHEIANIGYTIHFPDDREDQA